jgi:hypothetical protein
MHATPARPTLVLISKACSASTHEPLPPPMNPSPPGKHNKIPPNTHTHMQEKEDKLSPNYVPFSVESCIQP